MLFAITVAIYLSTASFLYVVCCIVPCGQKIFSPAEARSKVKFYIIDFAACFSKRSVASWIFKNNSRLLKTNTWFSSNDTNKV